MMRRWFTLTVMWWLIAPAQGQAATAELLHNPFSRPELGEAAVAGTEPVAAVSLKPELRATLTGGARPLANVNGRLLAVGDEIDGHRVTRIGEGFIEIRRGEEDTTLHIQAAVPKRTKGRR